MGYYKHQTNIGIVTKEMKRKPIVGNKSFNGSFAEE